MGARSGRRAAWITSDEAFHLPSLPKRIAILGGGYIGVEFAHIFAGLGAEVTLIHRDTLVLRGFDPDVREAMTAGAPRSTASTSCAAPSSRQAPAR